MIELSELLSPRFDAIWPLARQNGITSVVSLLDGGEQDRRMFASVGARGQGVPERLDEPWGRRGIRRLVDAYAEYGFTVAAIEDTCPMDDIRTAGPDRDAQIEQVQKQIRAMGEAGIPVLCYNWMALSSWARTDIRTPGRGGALVTGYSDDAARNLPPIAGGDGISHETLWSALVYFLAAVLPTAEESGVSLALHPDDPPLISVRGVPRIMTHPDAYRRILSAFPSPANRITFCQGNFALMADADVPALIQEFGEQGRIAFSHFRNVRGHAEAFVETFHDDGDLDMVACMEAYRRVGFSGPMRADHVPTLFGESNSRPGYETLGRLFAWGYLRGLLQATRAVTPAPAASPSHGGRRA